MMSQANSWLTRIACYYSVRGERERRTSCAISHVTCCPTAARRYWSSRVLSILQLIHWTRSRSPRCLARSGSNLLRGLDRLGAKAGRRALLLIDGINEGDRAAWRKALSSLSQRVREFENVGIVLTCRRPYEELLLKSNDAKGYVRVEHFGFEDREFDAQLEYFSHYGLSAPDVPLIAPEFSRPLFLKILCEAISGLSTRSGNRKLKEIASGQKGMTYVLEYFVSRVGKAVEQDFGLPGKTCWRLLKGISETNPGIAGIMAADSRDWVTRDQAVRSIQRDLGYTEERAKSLLRRLIGDGLLGEELRCARCHWLTSSFSRTSDSATTSLRVTC